LGIDAVAEVLHVGLEAFIKILLWGIVTHQDANIHHFHQALGAETLKVLADGGVGLP